MARALRLCHKVQTPETFDSDSDSSSAPLKSLEFANTSYKFITTLSLSIYTLRSTISLLSCTTFLHLSPSFFISVYVTR